ncbi:MAG TPA: hypothetical protein PK598_15350 [Thermoanaerobaculia bacterium]|nr:hypothetical protein [Thermoanaerobaculia bacterium]
MRHRPIVRSAAALAALLLAGGPALAADEPNTKRLGKTVAQYSDANIQVAVSWKYPQLHPDEKWTYFETWVMPFTGGGIEINREDVSLFLPDGTRVPLPSQEKLGKGLPDIRRVLTIGDVSRDPMEGYFSSRRVLTRIGFQEIPGTFLVYDTRGLAPYDCGYGDFFFENPKGKWEKGIYTLVIQKKGLDVKIPMQIGIEGELERVK